MWHPHNKYRPPKKKNTSGEKLGEGNRKEKNSRTGGRRNKQEEKKVTLISRRMRGGMRKRSAIVSAIATVLTTLMMRISLKRRSGFTMRIILSEDVSKETYSGAKETHWHWHTWAKPEKFPRRPRPLLHIQRELPTRDMKRERTWLHQTRSRVAGIFWPRTSGRQHICPRSKYPMCVCVCVCTQTHTHTHTHT